MTRHDPAVRMGHMLDYVREAWQMAEGRSRQNLDCDRQLALALTRLLEIVGEAAAQVPPEVRKQHPQIPWREIIGMRNRLIHTYDRVDMNILWDVIEDDLPPLAEALEKILKP